MSSHVAQIHVLVIASTHWTVIASIMRLLSRILVVMVLVLVLVMMVAHLTVVVIPHPLLLLLLIVSLVLVLRLVMMSEPRLMIGAYFLSRLQR